MFETADWPRSFWKSAQKRAESLGLTISEYVTSLYRREAAAEEACALVLTPKNLTRISALAALMEVTPTTYLDWVLNGFLDDVHDSGRIMEIDVIDRLRFDSRAEARRICRKVVDYDAERAAEYNEGWGENRVMPNIRRDSEGAWVATWRKEAA